MHCLNVPGLEVAKTNFGRVSVISGLGLYKFGSHGANLSVGFTMTCMLHASAGCSGSARDGTSRSVDT